MFSTGICPCLGCYKFGLERLFLSVLSSIFNSSPSLSSPWRHTKGSHIPSLPDPQASLSSSQHELRQSWPTEWLVLQGLQALECAAPRSFQSTHFLWALLNLMLWLRPHTPTRMLLPCPQRQSQLGDCCAHAHSHHYVTLPGLVATFASESLCDQRHESERQGMVFALILY